jgi:hypothetical protein
MDSRYRNCTYTVLDDIREGDGDLVGFNTEAEFKRMFMKRGEKGEINLD